MTKSSTFHCKRCERDFQVDRHKAVPEDAKAQQCGCGVRYLERRDSKGRDWRYMIRFPHDDGGVHCGSLVREGLCEICGIPLFGDGHRLGRNRCSEHKGVKLEE